MSEGFIQIGVQKINSNNDKSVHWNTKIYQYFKTL